MIRFKMQFFGGRGASGGGKSGSGGSGGGAKVQQPVVNTDSLGFKDYDDADYHQLYNGKGYYQQQQLNDPSKAGLNQAIDTYIEAYPTPGSLYSPSQQLNHAMKTNQPLTKQQQQMRAELEGGMHNLGYNLTLTRYARNDYMENLSSIAGVKLDRFYNMKESDLQTALVGKSFSEAGFISTSYNNFAKAPNGGRPFTDKTVKINYKAPAKTQALMPRIGAGGDLGEIILAPDQNYRIVGVRFTGKKGRSQASYYNQIELDVEIF